MDNVIVLVNPNNKLPETLKPTTFAELKVQERKHLEEWIKANPDILGAEPLLLITSEYDRFDNSDKRLDLLAMDKEGRLVIIELKRDATGSLADLQAIRYAAFCSTMSFKDVVQMYARFIHKDEETAREKIREFVGDASFSEIGNQPRIILAAGGFDDQELTGCVLWLRKFRIEISCVEITPYRLPETETIVLVPRVIIPLPETKDFMVSAERKEAEEGGATLSQERNGQILKYFDKLAPGVGPQSAWNSHYMQIPSGHPGVHLEWLFKGRGQNRSIDVALHAETASSEKNKQLCLFLKDKAAEAVLSSLGEPATFDAEGNSRGWTSVFIRKPYDEWDEDVARWAAETMNDFRQVLMPFIEEFHAAPLAANSAAPL